MSSSSSSGVVEICAAPRKSINVLAVTTTHTMSKLRAIAMLPVSSEAGGDDGAVVGEGNG